MVEVLEGIRRRARLPRIIRVDQGAEFVSRDLDIWSSGVTFRLLRVGQANR